jgi:hypothetical protein
MVSRPMTLDKNSDIFTQTQTFDKPLRFVTQWLRG